MFLDEAETQGRTHMMASSSETRMDANNSILNGNSVEFTCDYKFMLSFSHELTSSSYSTFTQQ